MRASRATIVGVVVEGLVEIAEAVEEDGVRVLRLQVEVLPARGDERFPPPPSRLERRGWSWSGTWSRVYGRRLAWTRGLQRIRGGFERTLYFGRSRVSGAEANGTRDDPTIGANERPPDRDGGRRPRLPLRSRALSSIASRRKRMSAAKSPRSGTRTGRGSTTRSSTPTRWSPARGRRAGGRCIRFRTTVSSSVGGGFASAFTMTAKAHPPAACSTSSPSATISGP